MRGKLKLKPWSKLKREIYKLFSKDLKIQLHCVSYRMDSAYGSTDLPRYWITLGKETIWDYPRDFKEQGVDDHRQWWDIRNGNRQLRDIYPHGSEITVISEMIREYINTPKTELLVKSFEQDRWGLTDILRAADRRVGKKHLAALKGLGNEAVNKIIAARLKDGET